VVRPIVGAAIMPMPSHAEAKGLAVEWCGPHALIRRQDEIASQARVLSSLPHLPGTVVVMASPGAHKHADLLATVRSCLIAVRSKPHDTAVHTAWLAVSELGDPAARSVSWLRRLSAELRMDVLAPDGVCVPVFGSGLYVGPAYGGHGWRRFGRRGAGDLVTTRFPVPPWEYLLPYAPFQVAGLVAGPVPAGLMVRPVGMAAPTHVDPEFGVPTSLAVPKVVVGGGGTAPDPAAVAEILLRLPMRVRSDVLVVPTTPATARTEWIRELAGRVGDDVVVSAGTQVVSQAGRLRTVVLGEHGDELLAPFATMVRHNPEARQPEVIDVVPPPPGWVQCSARHYRRLPTGPRTDVPDVFAEVLPGGVLLRQDGGSGPAIPFDPAGWVLAVGTPGEAIAVSLLPALQSLLDGLNDVRRRTVRVRLLGLAGPAVVEGLERIVRVAGARLEDRAVATSPPPGPRSLVPPPAPSPVPTLSPAPAPSAGPTVPAPPPPIPPTMPVITVSGPDRPQPKPTLSPVTDPAPPPAEPVRTPIPEPVTELPVRSRWSSSPVVLDDRPSTAAEQARLSDSGGSDYTEALAKVNVALSAWPMLRPEAKADYIAVCMYLGYGGGGAIRLNEALSTGEPPPFDGYLPCLMSGLRRLPTHRRVVLRQEKLDDGAACPYPAGTVLDEPTFLSASAALDATTPDAGLDVLIWPLSARRTNELVMGRALEETVFPPGRRFKALAVLTSDGEPADDGPRAPRTAVLVRELVPDEDPFSAEALARDEAALSRLERAWQNRRDSALRLIEDPDLVARMTTPMTVAADSGVAEQAQSGGIIGVAS
jgi:hypothetical protein